MPTRTPATPDAFKEIIGRARAPASLRAAQIETERTAAQPATLLARHSATQQGLPVALEA